ncbi:unnamed protein product [Brassicogethes aeneus]|uniref:C2H2-type domain-containing protein n=1 Tax=Brassicogethes aeneus TaxID=1431903 RepID=A0A9P0FBC8_BRAAE|nr:unnamed protein product [Brassicogethes aeneus]
MELLFDGKCRTCLGVLSDSGTNVTQVQSEIISKSVTKLVNCVSLQDVICNDCFKCLNEFYYFIKKLKEVDEEINKITLSSTNNLKDFLEDFSNDITDLDYLNNDDNDHSYFTLPEVEANNPSDKTVVENTPKVNELATKIEIKEILNEITIPNDHCYPKMGLHVSCKEETNIKIDVDRAVSLQLEEDKLQALVKDLQNDGVLVNDISSKKPGRKRIIILGGGMNVSYGQCSICSKLFRDKELLAKHEEACKVLVITCVLCKETFAKQSLYNNHMREKHRRCVKCREYFKDDVDYNSHRDVCRKLFQCKICSEKFVKSNQLARHQSEVHNIKEVPGLCDICGKTFEKKSSLMSHKQCHTGEQQCTVCQKVLKNRNMLKLHMKNVHNTGAPQQCDHCGFLCRTYASLRAHLVRHEKNRAPKYFCTQCDKKFFTTTGLTNHRQYHHDQKKIFACEYCDKTFHRRDYLRIHTNRHLPSSSKIKIHKIGKIKIHKIEIRACPICKKEFNTAPKLHTHMKIHDFRPRRFKCQFCKLQFYVKANMKRHEKKAHGGEYKYRCDICYIKRFQTEQELQHHENSHNRTKKYSCKICGEAFARSYLLSNHILHEHDVIMNDDGDLIDAKTYEPTKPPIEDDLQNIEEKDPEEDFTEEEIHFFVDGESLDDLTIEYT